MKDVIWTLIVIWLIYKLVDIFRSVGQKKNYAYDQNQTGQNSRNAEQPLPKKDVKSAMQKGAEKEGEYIDFEEIK